MSAREAGPCHHHSRSWRTGYCLVARQQSDPSRYGHQAIGHRLNALVSYADCALVPGNGPDTSQSASTSRLSHHPTAHRTVCRPLILRRERVCSLFLSLHCMNTHFPHSTQLIHRHTASRTVYRLCNKMLPSSLAFARRHRAHRSTTILDLPWLSGLALRYPPAPRRSNSRPAASWSCSSPRSATGPS